IWNITNTPLDTAKWHFSDGVVFTFADFNPASSQAHFLKPMERIVVSAASDAATRAAYPTIPANVRVFGPWSGSLDNAGERVTLQDKNNVIVCTVNYGDRGHWPRAADGPGHSLVLADENRPIDDWRVWRASANNVGSAGIADPVPPAQPFRLNEAHFTAASHIDWIELRNDSSANASANGLFLTSKADLSGKVAVSGPLAAGGHASYNVDFPTSGSGDLTIYLVDSSNNVRDAVELQRTPGRDSMQRFPAGTSEWYSSVNATRDAPNDPGPSTAIVINEIMANPPSGQRDGEFIELYNRSGAPVDLGGWKLEEAVDFTFPTGTMLPSGEYLVVAANAAWLNANYPNLTAIGNWDGSLGNSGENIRLLDANGNLADEVDYRFGGEWPELADGNGSSLELVHPDADNALGGGWRDSNETTKSTWQAFTINGGTYRDLTQGGVNDDEIRLWLVGDGHLIIRNAIFRQTGGAGNLFTNAGVTTLNNNNVDGWQARGTHAGTFHDAEGVHIVADGGGDNKCNHAEKAATGMVVNLAYTLTFEARWVYGRPRLVSQSWDTSWGGTVLVPIPLNLGTPGAVNSRFSAAPPPLITGGLHSPAVPAPGQIITITARVSSADALSSVVLWHRLDNINGNLPLATSAMNDDGTGGDARANDGIYTVQINPVSFSGYNTLGAIVQFYIVATAANGQTGQFPRGALNPEPVPSTLPRVAHWVVDNQVVATDLRRMRTVISAYWLDALNQDSTTGGHTVKFNYKYPKLSNRSFPCTFIHNDNLIFYGSLVRKTGSPFTREQNAQLTRGRVTLPGNGTFRGKSRLYWDNDGAGGSMLHNRIHRYWLYLLGVPGNENEVCRVTRNRDGYVPRETSEVFDKDMLDRIWPNGSDGQFFEMDDKFWINDDGSQLLANADGSWDYDPPNSPGANNPVSYHNQFTPNSREVEYDYSGLIEWCRQLDTPAALTPSSLERMSDTQALTAYAAVRGYTGDWDNITIRRGKNGFFYQRSTDHRWTFLHWDSDLSFQNTGETVVGSLPNVGTYYGIPYVRRYLNYYFTQMIGPLASNGPRLTAWLTAEENASTAYVVPATYTNWASGRQPAIQGFIGTALTTAFSLTNPPSTTTANAVDINGRAPTTAFRVDCVGHPEAVLTWTGLNSSDVAPWRLSGIVLASGNNLLTFRMYNASGVQVGSDLVHAINKTGDAPPVVQLTSSPASQNVALGETLDLDAGTSYDPEGAGPLAYSWTISPVNGYTITNSTATTRRLVFSTPGTYTVTVQATDTAQQSASRSLSISVFNSADFDSFGGNYLTGYTIQSVELRDNYSPDAWYSLNETAGSLVVQVTDSAQHPLTSTAASFPRITRPLPATTDFSLQTSFALETRQFGSFATGLFLETLQGANAVRYAFCLNSGTTLTVYRTGLNGSYGSIFSTPYTGGELTLRVLRSGDNLSFQRRLNGLWSNLFTTTIPSDSTANFGGLFVSTFSAVAVRVAFDYLLLGDAGNTSDLINNLRITEVMYNPPSGGPEFIELTNIGATPLLLEGAYFDDGNPFDQFTFGAYTLAPGAFIVVTNDIFAFETMYGFGMIGIAGQFSGLLDNAGERIVLKDADGNVIQDFAYGSAAPWPTSPDGTGVSLEILSPTGDYNDSGNWRAGVEMNGSPGYLGVGFDSDSDGQSDRMELTLGTDPDDPASSFRIIDTSRNANGEITLTWPSAPDFTYQLEFATNLDPPDWQPLANVPSAGTMTSYTDTTAPGEAQRYYRATAIVP
ncbi:MAG TPA: lamin tail domain-containing protein, partial [Chthoniobacteraceae bacterium]|nr:lamin tail domain-containing protein [Chthoniobacteraceae bacterium]